LLEINKNRGQSVQYFDFKSFPGNELQQQKYKSFFFKFMGARLTITLVNFTERRATSTQQIQYNCDISFMDYPLLGNVRQLIVPLTISQEVDGVKNGFVGVYLVPGCYQPLSFSN
jgi:hypothetical protein